MVMGGTSLHLRAIEKTCTHPAGQPLIPCICTVNQCVPHPHELVTAAGTRSAGGQGKPGHASYWQAVRLRNVSQIETHLKTGAVELQGKQFPSSQKEIEYNKVTKMT